MTWDERREKVEEQERSGQSARTWCRENGLSHNTFTNWKSKLSKGNFENAKPTTVVWAGITTEELCVAETNGSGEISIKRDGWTVTIEGKADILLLAETLRAVKLVCC